MTTATSRIAPATETDLDPIRIPPSNTEAEQALLGAIFRNNLAHSRVSDFLEPEHFANAVHGRIYAAIGKLIERGQIANPVTLKNLFDQDGALAEIGGAQYLTRLAEAAVTIINAEDYGRRIHDLHLRRQLIGLGEDVVNDAFHQDLDDPAINQIERAEAKLYELASTGQAEGGPTPYWEYRARAIQWAEAALKSDGRSFGVGTGFVDLDKKLGGLRPGNLIILAGRPSMGKTAFAINIADNVARAGVRTLVFSLEMSGEDLATRLLAQESRIPTDRLFRGDVRAAAFEDFIRGDAAAAGLPLDIDDTPILTIAALRSRARRVKRRGGLGLIVVDYLQLMTPQDRRRDGNRVQEISEITRGLKAIAKELEVPVLALSQLSRAVEQREDKRPQLADLRESGSIEQDADVVMFLFREEYYLSRRDPDGLGDDERALLEATRGVSEVIIAKHRNGPIGLTQLAYDAELTRFSNLRSTA